MFRRGRLWAAKSMKYEIWNIISVILRFTKEPLKPFLISHVEDIAVFLDLKVFISYNSIRFAAVETHAFTE